MKTIIIIPARYNSIRFKGKLLAPLHGIPVIEHVYKNAVQSKLASAVIVATDNSLIFDTVKGFNGNVVMTSLKHESGTDRIAEVARDLKTSENEYYDIIVNMQGDEPMVRHEMIDDVIKILYDERATMGTLKKAIKSAAEMFDPNVVKVVTDAEGFAIYFSRSTIPYYRDIFGTSDNNLKLNPVELGLNIYKHIGIYSYKRETLIKLTTLPQSELEKSEKLEQLRAIENGIKIKVKETQFETIGVDTQLDLKKVESCLNTYS
jgi:3-deoxy-manno-octulosonate cytidylyltransferase (CMP-KDO synthetase)